MIKDKSSPLHDSDFLEEKVEIVRKKGKLISSPSQEETIRALQGKIERLNKVNQTLRNSREMFRINFEQSKTGMGIAKPAGGFIRVNQAMLSMLGYYQEEIEELNVRELIHFNDQDKYQYHLDKIHKRQKKTSNVEVRFLHKNGQYLWINLSITLAMTDQQETLYLLYNLDDITKKKLVNEKLKMQREELEYNRLKTNFFAKLSHEFKTPINLIFSTMQILDLHKNNGFNLLDGDKIDQYIEIIKKNVYRLLKLVNNLIDLTRIDSDSFILDLQNINIVEFIEEFVDSIRDYINDKQRKLVFSSEFSEKIIACDPYNIERIILNLISNALKFTQEYDTIEIGLAQKADKLLISVKDSGIGIEKAKLGVIFDRFRQIDDSFRRNTEGSGIGLSLVEALVKLHQGDISVRSEPGKGSEFIISLPIRVLSREEEMKNIYKSKPRNLIDKINVEFSDIYG